MFSLDVVDLPTRKIRIFPKLDFEDQLVLFHMLSNLDI